MDATGVSHIVICVRDLDKSLAFYRDILGMRVTSDRIQDTNTGGLPRLHKNPRKTRRQVRLRFPLAYRARPQSHRRYAGFPLEIVPGPQQQHWLPAAPHCGHLE